MPDTAERRPGARGGVPEARADSGTSNRVIHPAEPPVALPRAVAELIELSDERDAWQARLGDEYRLGWRLGYAAGVAEGRADACVALAEIEDCRDSVAWWREWSAAMSRIIQADRDPSVRLNQVMAEIAADQAFAREARRKLATAPASMSPMEYAVLGRVRMADPAACPGREAV